MLGINGVRPGSSGITIWKIPHETVGDTAVALEERLKQKWLFQWPEEEDPEPIVKEELPDDNAPGSLASL